METLVAFPFFYLFFTMIVQIVLLENAALVTEHAAAVAARAAVVVAPDDPRYYGGSAVNSLDGSRRDEIVEAVKLLVGTTTENPQVDVQITGSFSKGGSLSSSVTLTYPCKIPFGGHFVCGLDNRRRITRTAQMPYQGANYQYP